MATIYSPLGDISGSVGNLTFSKRNGQNVLGQKIATNTSNTPAQQETRAKFSLLSSLYKRMAAAVLLGLKASGGASGYNQFMANNFDFVSVDAQMNATADYTKLELSEGAVLEVAGLKGVKATAAADTVTVSWTNNTNGNSALGTDLVNVVLVKKTTGEVIMSLGAKARSASPLAVQDARLAGVATADVQVLAFAQRADGSDASPTTRIVASVS
ncbi:hypothetical protein FY528_04815 [Hymenobacter lutimineralis]|uniref:Uncharacterized protein n=1 Tax=Hymenobacter lutimineralis TaxID=2606448 RepID=A0A5D6VBQ3_9BACT|nr:DUF6266 family protein [Hymenobacter lutimineralis]TYZ12622.1 hypothetical protein FY528_04815 [Hymenobacter lutimineralis]